MNKNATGKKRTRTQRLADFIEIERMDQHGMTEKEIAEALSKTRPYTVTQQTISNDMKELHKIWDSAAGVKIDREKGRMKFHLEALIRENYEAWERSQNDAVTITETETEIKSKKLEITIPAIERQVQTKGQVGDGRFLTEVRQLLHEYRELFGMDPPKKIASTTPDGSAPAPMVNIYVPDNGRDR